MTVSSKKLKRKLLEESESSHKMNLKFPVMMVSNKKLKTKMLEESESHHKVKALARKQLSKEIFNKLVEESESPQKVGALARKRLKVIEESRVEIIAAQSSCDFTPTAETAHCPQYHGISPIAECLPLSLSDPGPSGGENIPSRTVSSRRVFLFLLVALLYGQTWEMLI
ncbi:hypothetical protein J6590_049594 [Homalodisca vitripennis]|nr:hypothetical protein J6590_049594 [Homalodisca vitripennis]